MVKLGGWQPREGQRGESAGMDDDGGLAASGENGFGYDVAGEC